MSQGVSSDTEWTSKVIVMEESLKSGSFGIMHKVIHARTKKVAVLKESPKPKEKKKQSEQTIWKSVSGHPYIVQLFTSFPVEDKIFYIFEYFPKGSIWSFIKVHKKLHSTVAKILTSQIALAIHFIHGKNIFHRDISNKNIFLSRDGKAKLSNFQYSVMENNTQIWHGHILYQAPEAFSDCTCDTNADWFSLGICLYEMVVGMTPVELHCLRHNVDFQKLDDFGKVAVMMASTYYMPKVFSKNLKGALAKFLNKDVKKRLGYNDDLESIKEHPFFKDVDWKRLECGELTADLPDDSCLWFEKDEFTKNVTEKKLKINI
ncbi:probable serine/threonine-protein kinase DDB_G0277449 isoform X2 [Parasteatoda tepidariorum]|uniref:probable serine/threonine-protein kinase DDB_G0277449 isoform X1 n=1 Tax=Parasteatoda tepidariorum TaxID=114398 RepID=UPI001C721FA1|nr:probable serine/threonine-protein kinase DDB_G0277449 [Parasteatoda tepidariorum]